MQGVSQSYPRGITTKSKDGEKKKTTNRTEPLQAFLMKQSTKMLN